MLKKDMTNDIMQQAGSVKDHSIILETKSTIERNLETSSESQTRRDVELEVPVSNKKSEQVEQSQSLQRSGR